MHHNMARGLKVCLSLTSFNRTCVIFEIKYLTSVLVRTYNLYPHFWGFWGLYYLNFDLPLKVTSFRLYTDIL